MVALDASDKIQIVAVNSRAKPFSVFFLVLVGSHY